jgi:hypothetical protein
MYLPSDTLTASVVYLHHKLHAELKMRPGSRSALAAPSQPALAPQFGCSVVQLRIRLGCSSFGDSALRIGEGSQAGCGGPGPHRDTVREVQCAMRIMGPAGPASMGSREVPADPEIPISRSPRADSRFGRETGRESSSDSRLFWRAYLPIESTLNGNRPS